MTRPKEEALGSSKLRVFSLPKTGTATDTEQDQHNIATSTQTQHR